MLVLSRKLGEKILLPELGIEFEIVLIKCNQVRVGITAPEELKILRGELSPHSALAGQPFTGEAQPVS